MIRQIKKQAPVFVAIVFLFVGALAVGAYILSHQRFYLPAWVPLIGTDFYVVEAELPTGQAVVPGQGQTVNIAGVKVGEVGAVTLEDGKAVVDMQIKAEFAPIYRNATILLRPKTGLKDMFLALDPGTPDAGDLPEGGRVRVARTLQDINADEVLAQLDADTRAYLQVLLNAGGEAFTDENETVTGGRDRDRDETENVEVETTQTASQDLRETLKRFEPLSRNGRRITEPARQAPQQPQARDPQLPAALDRARPQGQPARRAGRLGQRQLRGAGLRRGQPARGAPALPAGADADRERAPADAARWPRSSALRSSACARSLASSPRRCAAPVPSCVRPRRSSATRSGPSRATSSRPCATCAARPRTWRPSRRG